MDGRKLAKAFKGWLGTIKGRRVAAQLSDGRAIEPNMKAAFLAGAKAVEGKYWTNEIGMVELHHAIMEHCQGLRETVELMEAGKFKGAMARLEGSLAELQRHGEKQVRDKKIEMRRGQKRG